MSKQISNLTLVNEVSDVQVNENGEPFVLLNDVRPDKLVVFSKAFKDGRQGAIEDVYVRQEVKGLLVKAAENLPKGYKLAVWEAYTPKALQEALRNTTLEDISGIAHMTGGAVDVSLADEEGNLLDMGTDLSHSAPQNKNTLHFEEMEQAGAVLSEQERELRDNRRILFHAMSDAGFINNPLAWFHWDYGNRWWAKVTGSDAFYGSLDK